MRNKTTGDAKNLVNNIINQNNLKNNINPNLTNQTKNEEEKKNNNNSNNNIANNNTNNINHNNAINNGNINSNKSNNILQFTKTGTSSFLDCNLENSHSEIFSIIGNTTINDNKFLFETTELPEQSGENQGTPTLTPRSIFLDTKDISNNSYLNMNTSNSGISDIINDSSINIGNIGKNIINECKIKIGKNINNESNKNVNEKVNKIIDNRKESKNKINVDNFINNNKFSFAPNNYNVMKNSINNNKSDKHYYDFKYISSNKIIRKLLLYNNDKVKSGEIFSSQIYFILNGNKKRRGLLLITSQCFYILDDSNDMNVIIRICHNLLSSISLPQENFNHLLLSFSDDSYIIIEIYQRIHLLNYLKELYSIYKYKKLNIYFCQSFNIKSKNNHSYLYDLKTNKDIILTPNFEGAQKLGFLKKYKESIFSAYFTEKLIVLCSIGLVVFSKSNINVPKLIIPLIGSTVEFTTAYTNEKLFCFIIKTVNNETFMFGSPKKNETNDWIEEIKDYQKFYEIKMNELLADCIIVNPKNKTN